MLNVAENIKSNEELLSPLFKKLFFTKTNSSLPHPRRSRLFEECVQKSWWVIVFFLFSFFAYDHAMKRRLNEEAALKKKLADTQLQKEKALELQADLKFQIASEDDPAWIELILMKDLGLVPEGQKKVVFKYIP